MLVYQDLTEPERALWDALSTGALVDLRIGEAKEDDPANGGTWGLNRQVRAELLHQLLTGLDGSHGGRRALRLAGARITGELDLEATTLVCPVTFVGCYFDKDIYFNEARTFALRFTACIVPALYARQLQVHGNLELNEGFTSRGLINLFGAEISGMLNLEGATLTNPNGFALNADSATVGQSIFCGEGFRSEGEVRLFGARVKGDLNFAGATLHNWDAIALNCGELTVDRDIKCTHGFTARGRVYLVGAHVGGYLVFWQAAIVVPGHVALDAKRLSVSQDMICGEDFNSEGGLDLSGAHIAGQLSLSRATIKCPSGSALDARGLTVDQDLHCDEDFSASGETILSGAHIGGQLHFNNATLSNPHGIALRADRLTVAQSLVCTSLIVTGVISLRGTKVCGQLSLTNVSLSNSKGPALAATRLTVEESMTCREGFNVNGEVILSGASIGGLLQLGGAQLSNPGGRALTAARLAVGQDLLCDAGFKVMGDLSLVGAHIGGTLSFDGSVFFGIKTRADLESVRARSLWFRPATPPDEVDLRYAQVDIFTDDFHRWSATWYLQGFAYNRLHEPELTSVSQRIGWLRRDPARYAPQPFEQLATVYRAAGREEDARKVAIAKQHSRSQVLNLPGKVWSGALRWTIGYGYQTWLAVLWLLWFLIIGWAVFATAYPDRMTLAKNPSEPHPHFQPLVYALDTLLPVVDLHQQDNWIPRGFAQWWAWISILAGWILTTAVVAALTGLIRRN